tara:strand:- start:31 stop:822 length:792 start_codon:yes stop_codon:yes gene_type:complete
MSGFLNKIIRGALGDIISKPKTDVGNLPVDKTRRGIIAGGVAAPVAVGAGVLSEIPINKIIDDVIPVKKFDDWERLMSRETFEFDKNPEQYVEFMREIFSESTGLSKNKFDDFLLGERAIQNKLSGYHSIEEYAERMLGVEDAEKFLKKNKVDLNFHKTSAISGEDASAALRKKLVKGVDTGEEGLSKFDELSESFGEFNVEDNIDSDYSVEPLFKDSMLQESYGKGNMDWEKFIQIEGPKTVRFKELKSVIDKIDKLAEVEN